jgi:hypothetical protein
MSDVEAVEELVSHRYFQCDITPVQVFNRATDPFLPNVRPHTFAVLEDLDERGLRNHVLVITRHQMKAQDAERLNQLRAHQADVVVHVFRDRQQANRAVSVSRGSGVPEIDEPVGAAQIPNGLVLAAPCAGPQRH